MLAYLHQHADHREPGTVETCAGIRPVADADDAGNKPSDPVQKGRSERCQAVFHALADRGILPLQKQHLGFEGFRVRNLKAMNALNRYLSYAI